MVNNHICPIVHSCTQYHKLTVLDRNATENRFRIPLLPLLLYIIHKDATLALSFSGCPDIPLPIRLTPLYSLDNRFLKNLILPNNIQYL